MIQKFTSDLKTMLISEGNCSTRGRQVGSQDNRVPSSALAVAQSLFMFRMCLPDVKTLAGGEYPRLKTSLPASWQEAVVLAFNLPSVRDFGHRSLMLHSFSDGARP
jgi:hypothetical protein